MAHKLVLIMLDQVHMTSLFENATEGIILTNNKGEILIINPAAERMFGYSDKELQGRSIEILVPDQFKPNHHKLREGFYHNPSNRVMGQGRDLYGKKKDGTNIPVEVSLSHYHRENELFVIAFIVDITLRKKIEESLLQKQNELERASFDIRRLNTELEGKVEERTQILKEALIKLEESQLELKDSLDKEKQLNEIKSRFVSMASHEFRTPLSTVLSSASLLSKYTSTDEQDKRNRHIDKIKDSVKHLNDILEDFLSLGKLDEGKVITSFNDFNLKEFVYEVVDEIKGLLKPGQKINISYRGKEDIFTDKKLLRNIFFNLLSNAIKFSDEGKSISLDCKVDEIAAITVSDSGIGIAEKDQEHLFSSFFRGANALNIQGTGLGLHIVKRYVNLLHGDVNLKSKLGKGTTINVEIPVTAL